jgi:hypothetical protein
MRGRGVVLNHAVVSGSRAHCDRACISEICGDIKTGEPEGSTSSGRAPRHYRQYSGARGYTRFCCDRYGRHIVLTCASSASVFAAWPFWYGIHSQ